MDRFFSKLDLRDIKIKPEGNRYLPEDDEIEPSPYAESDTVETAEDYQTSSAPVAETIEDPYVFDPVEDPSPSWINTEVPVETHDVSSNFNGHSDYVDAPVVAAAPPRPGQRTMSTRS